jgi:TPR repeat protein
MLIKKSFFSFLVFISLNSASLNAMQEKEKFTTTIIQLAQNTNAEFMSEQEKEKFTTTIIQLAQNTNAEFMSELEECWHSGSAEDIFKFGERCYFNNQHYFANFCYKTAADKGLAKAQYMFGISLEVGASVEGDFSIKQDLKEAADYFKKAADQGFTPAQYYLAVFLERGLGGLERNTELAINYYKRAAHQGLVYAEHPYGITPESNNIMRIILQFAHSAPKIRQAEIARILSLEK